MSNTTVIKEASETDLPRIESLLTELINTMDNSKGIDLFKALENYRFLLKETNSHFLVAKINGSAVGFINFSIRKTVLHPGSSALIDELVVSEQYRGQGIGRQLVSTAVERARGFGCCEAEVSTEKVNSKAREFYKNCGFQEDAVLLELHL
jgi:GNAT superfamily N-acetyltransferase